MGTGDGAGQRIAREKRLAEALKANLKRRKVQLRQRADGSGSVSEAPDAGETAGAAGPGSGREQECKESD